MNYRATPGIFGWYSVLTEQYLVNNPLAKMLHCSSNVVLSEETCYKALNAADKAILNEHSHRDGIVEHIPAVK